MSESVWSWVLATPTLLTYALGGRASRKLRIAAWWVTIVTEPLWLVYGWHQTQSLLNGFSMQAVFFVLISVWNLRTLRREKRNDVHDRTKVP